ncbi:MAG: hypothetical protein IPJ81_01615 [Chitinophagaceae bacterium]|nr:hypothetical protein [Chitinophagaceae bacterium]
MNINKKTIVKRIGTLVLFFLFISFAKAQNASNAFAGVDTYVSSLGSLDTLNMGTIAKIITQKFSDKKEKARAVFVWITNNISYETKAARAGDAKNNTSDAILKNRKAGGQGYATLFQDMCSVAGIRCLTVDGFLKRVTENINEEDVEINHSWAVVQLGQSPEQWFYVDAALGSGYLDKKGTTFTRSFDDAYFFANKLIFNNQHYPDNQRWQLVKGPKNKKTFYQLPIIKNGAYQFNVTDFAPDNGIIKVKAGKVVNFGFSAKGPVTTISLLIEENKKRLVKAISNPVTAAGKTNFTYTFEDEGTYDVTILINDKETLQYLVEVE